MEEIKENINCRDSGSNQGTSDLQSDALPTELSRRRKTTLSYILLIHTLTETNLYKFIYTHPPIPMRRDNHTASTQIDQHKYHVPQPISLYRSSSRSLSRTNTFLLFLLSLRPTLAHTIVAFLHYPAFTERTLQYKKKGHEAAERTRTWRQESNEIRQPVSV